MDFLALDILAILFVVALIAGWIDAIAGGGGLLALPALLWAGLPPAQALATNKLQGCFGTFSASYNFWKKGHVKLKDILPLIALTFVGSALGTLLIQSMEADFLIDLIPFLILAVGLYFLFQPRMGEIDKAQRLGTWGFALTMGFGIGFYDGFFGPGTGSFFTLAFVALMGFNLLKASAHTKILNFTSNIASLIFFALGGQVVWVVGLVMAMGQMIGGYLGAHMSMKHGSRLIRPLLVVMSLGLTFKLIWSSPDHVLHQWVASLL